MLLSLKLYKTQPVQTTPFNPHGQRNCNILFVYVHTRTWIYICMKISLWFYIYPFYISIRLCTLTWLPPKGKSLRGWLQWVGNLLVCVHLPCSYMNALLTIAVGVFIICITFHHKWLYTMDKILGTLHFYRSRVADRRAAYKCVPSGL